jgi:acyl-CoA reductase-like NAD-dependent aldehyde dehydrogenase
LEENLDEIAETMTREMGKTLPEAKGETARGVAILRYYAGEGMRKDGDVIPSSDKEALMFTKRTPLGVVGIITPWNFPVAILENGSCLGMATIMETRYRGSRYSSKSDGMLYKSRLP